MPSSHERLRHVVEDVGAGAVLVAVRRKDIIAWDSPLSLWPWDGRWSGRQHRTSTPVRRRESESCSVCCSVTDAVTDDTATEPCHAHAVSVSLQLIQHDTARCSDTALQQLQDTAGYTPPQDEGGSQWIESVQYIRLRMSALAR